MVFVALLDANVFWSAAVRDTLLLAAERDLFRPVWSRQILDEMASSLKNRRPDLDPARIDRTVYEMVTHFPEALIDGYQSLIGVMTNHGGDRHVLAAAVRAGASVIVTWNKDHFPSHACDPYDIDIQNPDQFLCHLWHLSSEDMADVLTEQAGHLMSPPRTTLQVVETLRRSMPQFAQIAQRSGLI